MGTDFRKLKVPFIWYEYCRLSTCSRGFVGKKDARSFDMLEILKGSSKEHGRVTPASIWYCMEELEYRTKERPSDAYSAGVAYHSKNEIT
jgi:hypothetical protein